MSKPNIALLYTGGTIGMKEDVQSKRLVPLDFDHLHAQIPELEKLEVEISFYQLWEPIDSSDIQPKHWQILADKIAELYDAYDGFVILHGTDTMAYTASALSFMLQNLSKPVILTGSQLPIGVLRTDGKENIISAIEIAAAKINGKARVPEVCIYFEYKLIRGNRAVKLSTEHFDAFKSPNYPALAEAGVDITYQDHYIDNSRFGNLNCLRGISPRVGVIKLFPGFQSEIIDEYLRLDLYDALILEAFGTGNIGAKEELLGALERWCRSGKLLINATQCVYGSTYMDKYASSANLSKIGALESKDMTFEAILCKLMISLGNSENIEEARNKFTGNWAGEQK